MAQGKPGDSNRTLEAGTLINNRYRIERVIGSGGMGSVYLARDEVIGGEPVAVKVLHTTLLGDERQMQRFMREVQLMRRVNQRNVVRTFDVGSDRDCVYFTMEYVPGRPLEDFVDDQSFPLAQIPNLIIQICEGLEAIHKAGVIHRDLKPANIIVLEDGTAKITDFGVARPEYSELTAHNEIVGSALYISPEVWLGTRMSPSVDLYSLGVMLFELTTGLLPFEGDSPAALMRMHLEHEPEEPKRLNKKIAPWLNKLILKLLAKSELDRPRDAREVIETVKLNTDWGSKGEEHRLTGLSIQRRHSESEPTPSTHAVTKSVGERELEGAIPVVEVAKSGFGQPGKLSRTNLMRYTTVLTTPTTFGGEVVVRCVLAVIVATGTLGLGSLISVVLTLLRAVHFEASPEALSSSLIQVSDPFPSLQSTLPFVALGWVGALLRAAFPLTFIGAMAGMTPFAWRFFTRALGAGVLSTVVLAIPFIYRVVSLGELNAYSLYSSALAIQQQLIQIAWLDPQMTKYSALLITQGVAAVPERTTLTLFSGNGTVAYLVYAFLAVLFVRRAFSRRVSNPGRVAVGLVGVGLMTATFLSSVLSSGGNERPAYRSLVGEEPVTLSILVNSFLPLTLFWTGLFLTVFFVTLVIRQRTNARGE